MNDGPNLCIKCGENVWKINFKDEVVKLECAECGYSYGLMFK